jgi:hypothetical protein
MHNRSLCPCFVLFPQGLVPEKAHLARGLSTRFAFFFCSPKFGLGLPASCLIAWFVLCLFFSLFSFFPFFCLLLSTSFCSSSFLLCFSSQPESDPIPEGALACYVTVGRFAASHSQGCLQEN